ncbi:MAG: DUF917 domain-containing protein [Thermomicrobiales bacterium]|nr:DUF917 domain-containing protein [Thermomicrobiales bacterium]MCO5222186.1 DUF917 domain-containing protein [Thermomicrobiales bacterium]
MRTIDIDDLNDLAVGAAVLGTGGGGDPYIGRLMAAEAIRQHGPVQLIDPTDLDPDALVLPVGMMGAPTVMVEKLPGGLELTKATETLEAFLGEPATAVMATEAGGINSTLAMIVAVARGIPLVDADLVGRAFPELQMCTPTLYGTQACPMALADDKDNASILQASNNRWAERLARTMTIEMGCWSLIALYPMRGRQVAVECVQHTPSTLIAIGAASRTARVDNHDPIDAICAVTKGIRLWSGKVVDVARKTVGGFARGEVHISALDNDRTLIVGFQNEFLVATSGDEVLATTPDLISMLDLETGEPITTEGLRYGHRVAVIGIPGDERWRTPAGLEVVGPSYFGYDIPFIPLEERQRTRQTVEVA